MRRGRFIVGEGGEGSGKTSAIRFLYEEFKGASILTREPGGTTYAEELRALVLSDSSAGVGGLATSLTMWSARADHMEQKIIPALTSGMHVFSDRFDPSSWTYNIFAQNEGKPQPEKDRMVELFWQLRDVVLGAYVPDLYLFFDVTPEVGLARRRMASSALGEELTRFDSQKIKFHYTVREGYRSFFSRNSIPSVRIDADRPQAEVLEAAKVAVQKLLGGS